MSLKKIVIGLVSASLMISSCIIPVNAQQSNGRFKMFNAPNEAQYNIYKDNNQNYIYDDEDTLIGTLNCNSTGVGYYNNLSEGYYVAVLQNDYPKLDTDKEYSFFSDGESMTSQEAYVSNKLSWNITYASTSDTININYDVPLYKQSDSRWGSLRVNGGSTMKSVGCLITSFAMLRSYETGETILPSQMMKSYSSSTGVGVVFSGGDAMSVPKSSANYGWNVYGNTSAYGGNGEISNNTKTNQTLLKVLYDKVKCGPVIYGGYSTYNSRGGSNHWIVVNGYVGDGVNFSASDFYICDPGANRTTLADYISKYPYWDRIIYNPNNTPQTVVTTTKLLITTTLIPNLTTLPKRTTKNSTATTTVTTVPDTTISIYTNVGSLTLPKETQPNVITTSISVPSIDTSESTIPTITTTVDNNDILLGDINQDGVIDLIDALELKKYLLYDETFINFSTQNADFDQNGKINLTDFNFLLNSLLKK